ncbi:MAG: hypothetical protein DSY80_02370 [Desulfocapsa sp.]|nr:MAG: hypothetical protein DSY80_02370 [Desulfocapsa sp.]
MGLFKNLVPKKIKISSAYLPSFLKKSVTAAQIADEAVNRANVDLTSLRYGVSAKEIIRNYAKVSPDLSQALNTYIRFIITDNFSLFAKGLETDVVDVEATEMIRKFATRLNSLPPDYAGYHPSRSFAALGETFITQLLCNGITMGEVVFDKARMPSYIQAVSTNKLKYKQKGSRAVPYLDGENVIDLDSPAIKSITLNQDPDSAYSDSWLESAVQAIVSSEEFRNDIRKAFRKASLPRVNAEIDTEKFLSSLTPETIFDPEKLRAAMEATIDSLKTELNGLNPEDCVVNFDVVKVTHLSQGNTSTHNSTDVHNKIVNGLVASGLKTLPSILGRGESQSTASTESVLFLKVCEGLQGRINELFSQMLTLIARVHGYDVTVVFKYKKPDLRPEIELESFYTMKQSRILEQLSLGLITDEEASILMTGDLPPEGFVSLVGTRFRDGVSADTSNNPYSNTSVSGSGINKTQVQKDQTPTNTQSKTNRTAK